MKASAKTQSKAKRHVVTALKFLFVAALMYLLIKKGFISVEATRRAFGETRSILAASGLLLFTTLLGIVRWQWLLRAQGIQLPWTRTFQLAFIGNFFNIALPGAVTGDFVKAFYIAKEVKGKRARAFSSILFDRVSGLAALVMVSAGALLAGYSHFRGTALMLGIQVMVIVSATVFLAFFAYLFLVKEKHDPLLKLFRAAEARVPKAGSILRIYEGLRHYHDHRLTVLKVLGISILIHSCVGMAYLLFAQAFGDALEPLAVLVVVPLGLLVTAIPVMPAGIGTGHAAFGWLFQLIGTQRGADVFSLFALCQLFFGGIGGLVYLRFRGTEPAPVFDAMEAT